MIVVPKKSAPDEPPRRRLCVDYRKVNALQPEVKRTDKGTGCLSLYPLPKIDEMFSKLGGATIFSTIDLRSGYYHIGLTRESRAKSAFVVPMGKWQFKRTPFGLSQAPAYFQLLIDKVLMGCSGFTMGYLDDIIIFSKTEEEHLQHLEEIFIRLRKFGLKMKHEKCSFFKKPHTVLGTPGVRRWFRAASGEIGIHTKDASPEDSQRGKAIPWTDWILLKVRTTFCRYFTTIDKAHASHRCV